MEISKSLWKEAAVLVREMSYGERLVVGEGSLCAMVLRLKSLSAAEWDRYSINLPDRQVAPFSYSQEEFNSLLDAHARAAI